MIHYYIGIDPGSSSGGIATSDGERLKLADATQRDIVDFLEPYGHGVGSHASLEKVSAMPGQGRASIFKFGTSFGELRMALVALQIPFETVTPGKWQRAMGCLSKGDKNVTKRKAQELFPYIKVTHWNADALLLAEYTRRLQEGAAG